MERYLALLRQHSTLSSERLLLRPAREEDAADFLEYASDPECLKGLIWPGVSTLEEAKDCLRKKEADPGFYVIEWRGSGKCIGDISLSIDAVNEKATVGYMLSRAEWGRGIMTEALRTLLIFCFCVLGLERVEAGHFLGNEASGRVMEKCGMRFEGIARHVLKVRGEFRDLARYAVLREDYF
jgi:ribosomal-protein-alanine N-acetyltransferase